MKKTAFFSIIVFVLAGCTSFLDIRTEGTMPTTGTDYTKSEAIFQSVSAAYAAMRLSEGEAFAYISVLEIPSDDADKGSTSTDAASTAGVMDNFKYGPTTTIINDMWVKFYNIASAANHSLEEMVEFKKAATTDEIRAYTDECGAEAKVIRA